MSPQRQHFKEMNVVQMTRERASETPV